MKEPSAKIDVQPDMAICGIHGEPFRPNWPSGYPLFVLRGLRSVLEQESFHAETQGEEAKIEAALKVRPICCRLDPLALLTLYQTIHEELRLWSWHRCELCDQNGLGAPMRRKLPVFKGGRVLEYAHVCFGCIVHRIRPAGEPG